MNTQFSFRAGSRSVLLAAILLLPTLASGQSPAERAAVEAELAQARAELDQAARRVAELSRSLGERSIVQIHQRGGQTRPMLGLVLGNDEAAGVRLQAVTPEGPAARAGLKSGDRITAIEGQSLAGSDANERLSDARQRLSGLEAGQTVQLDYERDGVRASASVIAETMAPIAVLGSVPGLDKLTELGAFEPFDRERLLDGLSSLRGLNIDIDVERIREGIEQGLAGAGRSLDQIEKRIHIIGPMLEEGLRFDAWRWQGLRLAPLDADLGRYFGASQGALVMKAEGDALASLQGGDVIVAVDGEAVEDPRAAMRRLAAIDPGQPVRLSVLRDRGRLELSLTAPEQPDVLRWFTPAPPPPPPAPPRPTAPPAPPSSAGIAL